MNFEQARFNMVEQQVRPWEVLDQDVLDLLYTVPRESFVPAASKQLAFSDLEIPLPVAGKPGECMWAPRIEARVMQALGVKKSDRVLEVGTGSGYFTALLAHRAGHVYSVEINPALADFGRANLARHGADNVTLETADGARGFGKWAPYDVIVLTGSVPVIPRTVLEQLAPGGRLFAVVGDPPVMEARLVVRTDRGTHATHAMHATYATYRETDLFETVLAPLVNAEQPARFKF
jgi:protein-L-isoaspartate(D-aspartate) O-methyltransferase